LSFLASCDLRKRFACAANCDHEFERVDGPKFRILGHSPTQPTLRLYPKVVKSVLDEMHEMPSFEIFRREGLERLAERLCYLLFMKVAYR